MTVRERVIASRLVQQIDNQQGYAKKIGLSYIIEETKTAKEKTLNNQKKEKCK